MAQKLLEYPSFVISLIVSCKSVVRRQFNEVAANIKIQLKKLFLLHYREHLHIAGPHIPSRRSPQLVVTGGHNIIVVTGPHICGQCPLLLLVPLGHKMY